MRSTTRWAVLALLSASVAVAVPSMAQAAVTPGTHAAAQTAITVASTDPAGAPETHPGVSVSAAPRGAVAPDIWETPCNTYANALDFYMHGNPDCAEFSQTGSTGDIALFNVYQVNSQYWAGYFEYLLNGFEYRLDFVPWEVMKPSSNIEVISVTITGS